MVMSEDFVTLLVGLELLALPSIALVGLRSGDRRAISTAWTFFLTSVVSTAIALMGFALLYGLTGSLEFASVRDLEVVGAAHSVAHGPLAVAVVLGVQLQRQGEHGRGRNRRRFSAAAVAETDAVEGPRVQGCVGPAPLRTPGEES
jgi:hypothetical protein